MEDERKGGAFLAPRMPTQPRYSLTSNNLDLFFSQSPIYCPCNKKMGKKMHMMQKERVSFTTLFGHGVGEPARNRAGKADRASKES